MSDHLPARLNTDEIFNHFETTHRQVMDMIQRIHDLCDDSDEGQTLQMELEAVTDQAVAGYEDVKILKFRNGLMENTIKEINRRQAEQLERIEHLEEMITNPRETERRRERKRGERNTVAFNQVMKSAHQSARR